MDSERISAPDYRRLQDRIAELEAELARTREENETLQKELKQTFFRPDPHELPEGTWEDFQRSMRLLHGLTEASPDPIWAKDCEGRVILANAATLKAVQRKRDEMLGHTAREWIADPEEARVICENDARIMESGGTELVEECVTVAGEVRVFRAHKTALRDPQGKVIGIVGVSRDVTQQRERERALRRSEERYRTLFESIDEGFCVIEVMFDDAGRAVDYCFLEVNPAFERHTGFVDAVGKCMREIEPDIEDCWIEAYGRVATTRKPERFLRESEALGRWFEVEAFPMGERGEPRVGVLFTDVTNHKRAEDALRESEESWRRLFRHAQVMVAVHDGPQHVFKFTNNLYNATVGPRPLIGLGLREAFAELDDPRLFDFYDEVYRTGKSVSLQENLARYDRDNDGELEDAWFNKVIQPRYAPDGSVIGVISIGYEVTNQVRARDELEKSLLYRKRAEAEHRRTNLRLNIALGAALLGTYDYVVDSRTMDLDARARRILGIVESAEVSLAFIHRMVAQPHRKRVRLALQASLDPHQRAPFDLEFEVHPADGSDSRWIRMTGQAAFHDGQNPARATRFIGTLQDVTKRKQEEQELAQSRDAAEAAARAKSAFLANMSHDIRTPLTAILGYSEVLAQVVEGDQAEMAERIQTACGQLLKTLNSVLNFARLEGGKQKLDLQPEHLAPEVRRVCEVARQQAESQGKYLKVEEMDEDLCAVMDPGALNRVLTNLIDNAIKYSNHGQTVQVSLRRSGEMAVLCVRDRGVGMSTAFQKHLFEPFSQEREKISGAVGGSGLGMAIAKQLIDLMGGDITVTSEEGKGTEISVSLPLSESEGAPVAAAQEPRTHPPKNGAAVPRSEPNGTAAVASGSTPSVLICEDFPSTRKVLKMLLRDWDVTFAENEDQLFERLDDQEVILLDINLDGRNVGSDLMREVRRRAGARKVRIIAFTAHAMPGQKEVFLEEGFDDYLPKPFTHKDLLSVLQPAS